MDVYRALNADVPQLLFTVLHQAGPMVSDEDFTRTVIALHMDVRKQAQAISEELHRWLEQQFRQQAEEAVQKLQRLAMLAENADRGEVQRVLERDYSRLARRVGTESLLGIQGSGEEVFAEEAPAEPDLAQHFANGAHIENIARTSFGTYDLIYQLGEGLTADLVNDTGSQEVTFAFSKGPVHYSDFRQEISALMELVGEQTHLIHASFWQRKLGLGTGKEFVLRLRLPEGEEALREVIGAIANAGRVGKETIVKRGKMLLGRRVL